MSDPVSVPTSEPMSEPSSASSRPTVEPAPARPAARGDRSRKNQSQGQWALGDREPLNANETFKAEDDALNVRARIESVYSQQGFDSISSDDLRGRFRWWGLYTQRKPGIDGGKTAILEPHELDDVHFMLRVRIDGGQLTTEQLRAIGEVSSTYARDSADITDRQNVQLHWIRVEDMPAIWGKLEAVGLSTAEACGDCPRVVLGSPVAGIAADEIIDPSPAIEEIVSSYIGTPEFSNLPRKYKTALTGHPSLDVAHEINDIAFVGVVHPEHGPGFDVWVGGGLSTNPMLAERLGAWVPRDEVARVWWAVTSAFRDYGYRRLRTKARLKFLIKDWGVARFRQVVEKEYLHRPLIDGPAPVVPEIPGDHIGVHRQKDGRSYIGFAPTTGRVSGTTLSAIADAVEAAGSTRVRTTPHQKLVVLDVSDDAVEPLVDAMAALGLQARPSAWRRNTIACTGLEYCKLAIVETKARAASVIDELERRIPDLDTPITLNVNGCPNSCARIQVADIGLKGQLVMDDDEAQVEGFQVHLGGGLALDAGFGRKVRGLKVTAEGVTDYVEKLTRRYLEDRQPGERFASWSLRADEEALLP